MASTARTILSWGGVPAGAATRLLRWGLGSGAGVVPGGLTSKITVTRSGVLRNLFVQSTGGGLVTVLVNGAPTALLVSFGGTSGSNTTDSVAVNPGDTIEVTGTPPVSYIAEVQFD